MSQQVPLAGMGIAVGPCNRTSHFSGDREPLRQRAAGGLDTRNLRSQTPSWIPRDSRDSAANAPGRPARIPMGDRLTVGVGARCGSNNFRGFSHRARVAHAIWVVNGFAVHAADSSRPFDLTTLQDTLRNWDWSAQGDERDAELDESLKAAGLEDLPVAVGVTDRRDFGGSETGSCVNSCRALPPRWKAGRVGGRGTNVARRFRRKTGLAHAPCGVRT